MLPSLVSPNGWFYFIIYIIYMFIRVRVGTAYDIPGCMSQPGLAPRRGVVVVRRRRRRRRGTFFIIDAAETSPCGIYTINPPFGDKSEG